MCTLWNSGEIYFFVEKITIILRASFTFSGEKKNPWYLSVFQNTEQEIRGNLLTFFRSFSIVTVDEKSIHVKLFKSLSYNVLATTLASSGTEYLKFLQLLKTATFSISFGELFVIFWKTANILQEISVSIFFKNDDHAFRLLYLISVFYPFSNPTL